MNIENIEAFLLVNHFGSINKASKALFLSQPSVTARIQSLERELDTKLFERIGKQLVLTDQAKEFLPFAEGIIQSYKMGKKRLKVKESSNQLVIGCTRLASNYLIPSLVSLLAEKFPDLRIKIVTDSSDAILNKVLNRDVNIGFVSSISSPLIESTRILESPIQLFVKPNHSFAAGDSIDIENLAKEPIVFFECGSLDWSMVHNLFQNLLHVPNIKYEADSMEAAKGIILQGAGIGFLPEICVREEVRNGDLVAVDIPLLANLSLKTNLIHLNGDRPFYFDEILEIVQTEARKYVAM